MNIPALPPVIDLDALPLERLAHHPDVPEEEKVGELARQFEAVLLRQILKNIQKTVIKSEWVTESTTRDLYQDMITVNLADSITRAGGLGLAKSLQAELTRQISTPEQKATSER